MVNSFRCEALGRYEGNLNGGKKNGEGKFYYENGEVYVGNFSNGYREGKGTVYFFFFFDSRIHVRGRNSNFIFK